MIKEVSGDILFSKADAIAHGVAPFDHFDSGLALSLREELPEMFKEFKKYCRVHNPNPGTAWMWKNESNSKKVINLLTQGAPPGPNHSGHPGRSDLVKLNQAVHALKKLIESEGLKSVALPRLATGVGGLNWDDVRPILYEILDDLDTPVYVYTTYVKGQEAME